MPSPPYRKASRQTGLWITFSLLGIAGLIGVVPFFGPQTVTFLQVALGLGFFVGMILLAVLITGRIQRGRRRRIADRLGVQGWNFNLHPAEAEKSAFLAPLEHLLPSLDLRIGPGGLIWLATMETATGTARLFEYEFVTGSGKTAQVHQRTVLAWPAGDPALPGASLGHLPGFKATRFGWLERRAVRKEELKDPAFADLAEHWSFFGDAGTGARFLTPAVRAELDRAPQGESWGVGGNFVCMVFRHFMDAENLTFFLDRFRQIMKLTA